MIKKVAMKAALRKIGKDCARSFARSWIAGSGVYYMSKENYSDILDCGYHSKFLVGLRKVWRNGWIRGLLGQSYIRESLCRKTTTDKVQNGCRQVESLVEHRTVDLETPTQLPYVVLYKDHPWSRRQLCVEEMIGRIQSVGQTEQWAVRELKEDDSEVCSLVAG